MPPTHDYTYRYRGPRGSYGDCRIRVYEAPGQTVVIASDLGGGVSGTAAAARIATELERRHGPDPARPLVWVEHYRYGGDLAGSPGGRVETFHLVTFRRADDGTLYAPERWHLGRAGVEALIGEPIED